jgi:hypothetical protein
MVEVSDEDGGKMLLEKNKKKRKYKIKKKFTT